tara:strand:+ start:1932 stop:2255 length:324 start_codon:yes stop_codon:yes gene_type:complete
MSNFEKKEQNLNQLIDKLNSISLSYSQPNYELEKIKTERNELTKKKKEIEKQNQELIREHKYLKEKIKKLQLEVNLKSEVEEKFNQDIEDLSQETENLVSEINKWQM